MCGKSEKYVDDLPDEFFLSSSMTSIRLMHGIAPKLSLQRELGQKLMYNLHQFTQKCIVRFVAKGVGQEHKRFCPTTRNLCIACFGTNHRSKECTSMVVSTIAEICPKM